VRTREVPVRIHRCRFRVRRGGDDLVWLGRVDAQQRALDLQPTLVSLIDEAQSPRPYDEERVRWLLCLLFSGLFRLRRETLAGQPPLSEAQRARLRRYVHDRLAYGPEPRELARELGLSLDYFTRIFRRSFGVPPRTWLLQERVRLAAVRVVESRDPLATIARDFGYADPNLFGRQFRRVMGVTPSAFRERHGG
jgi:AraC-like DNA-binding protein